MQVLIAISGFCGFCSRIGNTPCTTPFDFLFVISIHIPAWGTTTGEALAVCCIVISIHVPAWGTTKIYPVNKLFCYFNPRSRVGNDTDDSAESFRWRIISIHVPAWGTTTIPFPKRSERKISIHVPAWGTTPFTQNVLISL